MFQIMWVICTFDLPTKNKKERKAYTQFRLLLLSEGLHMIQYSIYGKAMSSFEKAKLFSVRIAAHIPENGSVKFFFLTDKQMGMTLSFTKGERIEDEKTSLPSQGELF